jgi:hypothetical protein
MADTSSYPWYVQRRVPVSYLGCASGITSSQNRPLGLAGTDGVLYGVDVKGDSRYQASYPTALEVVSFKKVPDGLSKTIAVGEAVPDVQHLLQLTGPSGYPPTESTFGSRKDHWHIGGDDTDGPDARDSSEALGSTGVPPNIHKNRQCNCAVGISPECQALQLAFSSEHPGVVQVALCDGSIQQIEEGIDRFVWSRMGTRSGQYDIEILPPVGACQ